MNAGKHNNFRIRKLKMQVHCWGLKVVNRLVRGWVRVLCSRDRIGIRLKIICPGVVVVVKYLHLSADLNLTLGVLLALNVDLKWRISETNQWHRVWSSTWVIVKIHHWSAFTHLIWKLKKIDHILHYLINQLLIRKRKKLHSDLYLTWKCSIKKIKNPYQPSQQQITSPKSRKNV